MKTKALFLYTTWIYINKEITCDTDRFHLKSRTTIFWAETEKLKRKADADCITVLTAITLTGI